MTPIANIAINKLLYNYRNWKQSLKYL